MTLVLGIDTATSVSVGLFDGTTTSVLVNENTRKHVEDLMPLVLQLLEQTGHTLSELTAIGVGVGPGPFTGLRVGMVTAETLATVLKLPITGVCSLDVLAAQTGRRDDFIAAIDARRKEYYWARYNNGVRIEGPTVAAPETLPELPLVGPDVAIDAGALARELANLPDVGLTPLYLRRPDATEPGQRKSALTSLVGRRKKEA